MIIFGLLAPNFNNLQAYTRVQVNVSDLYLDVVSSFSNDVVNLSADEIASMLSSYNEKLNEFGISANQKPTQAQSEILLKLLPFGNNSIVASHRLISYAQLQLKLDISNKEQFISRLESEITAKIDNSVDVMAMNECTDNCADSFGISVGISMAIAVVVLALCGLSGPLAAPCAVIALEGMGLAFGGDVIGLLICLSMCPDDEVGEGE